MPNRVSTLQAHRRHDLLVLVLLLLVGRAATLALAGILSLAPVVAGLATALAFAVILAGAVVLALVLLLVVELERLLARVERLLVRLLATAGDRRGAGGAGGGAHEKTAERSGSDGELRAALHDLTPCGEWKRIRQLPATRCREAFAGYNIAEGKTYS